MEELLAAALQFVGELLLQMAFELMAELGLHSLKAVFEEKLHPIFAAVGYIILGAAAGGISLLIVPNVIIHRPVARIANLVITPLASGAAMASIGMLRRRREVELIRLDRFSYGALFALSMACVRYFWGG